MKSEEWWEVTRKEGALATRVLDEGSNVGKVHPRDREVTNVAGWDWRLVAVAGDE